MRGRIARYVEGRLQLDPTEAQALRDRYHKEYGATLGGLIAHHGVVAEEYLGMVHAVSLQSLTSLCGTAGVARGFARQATHFYQLVSRPRRASLAQVEPA